MFQREKQVVKVRTGRLIIWPWVILSVIGVLVIAGGWSCGESPDRQTDTRLRVYVTIAPQAFFAERVGGEEVAVAALVPSGQSIHTYEPTPRQVGELEDADLFFRIGVPFENRLIRQVAGVIGEDQVIDTRRGVKLLPTEGHAHHDENEHEPAGEGEALDPHIWLDPALVKVQVATMAEAMTSLRPERADYFAARLRQFKLELDSVDAVIRDMLAPYAGKPVYIFHPSYGYFTARYGLRQVAIEDEGKEPSAKALAGVIDRARTDSITVVFAQRQFAQKTAEAVATAIGARVVVLDPQSEHYLDNLVETARLMAESFSKAGT